MEAVAGAAAGVVAAAQSAPLWAPPLGSSASPVADVAVVVVVVGRWSVAPGSAPLYWSRCSALVKQGNTIMIKSNHF